MNKSQTLSTKRHGKVNEIYLDTIEEALQKRHGIFRLDTTGDTLFVMPYAGQAVLEDVSPWLPSAFKTYVEEVEKGDYPVLGQATQKDGDEIIFFMRPSGHVVATADWASAECVALKHHREVVAFAKASKPYDLKPIQRFDFGHNNKESEIT